MITKPTLQHPTGRLADHTCGVILLATGRLCGRPATAYLVGGCVHEHLSEGHFCADHRGPGLASGFNCRTCWFAAEPHPCPVLARDMTSEVIPDER
ncbi:hypothetical protein K8Z49_01485 [Actinomadura madurae]|uniref:hypothetical protein n=1 Tax=Actinomadura madurae TaxID=1993 RepID=UPI00399B5331